MLDSFIKYVVGELSVITQAPVSFLLCLAVIAIGAWRLASWRYAGAVESLEHRIKLRDDQIFDYKEKLSGATPDEAKNRIDALELQVSALSPRRLTVEQRQNILGVIQERQFRIDVTTDMGASEEKKLSRDYTETFRTAGWHIRQVQVLGINNPPQTGIAVLVLNPTSLRDAERIVRQALLDAKIPHEIRIGLQVAPPPPLGFPHHAREPDPDVGLLITSPLD